MGWLVGWLGYNTVGWLVGWIWVREGCPGGRRREAEASWKRWLVGLMERVSWLQQLVGWLVSVVGKSELVGVTWCGWVREGGGGRRRRPHGRGGWLGGELVTTVGWLVWMGPGGRRREAEASWKRWLVGVMGRVSWLQQLVGLIPSLPSPPPIHTNPPTPAIFTSTNQPSIHETSLRLPPPPSRTHPRQSNNSTPTNPSYQ